MNQFGIHVEDESEKLPHFVIEENEKFIQLHDWQREAIEYFFNHNGNVIFEVTTGAGKSFLTIEILKRIWKEEPRLKALVVVPKNVILEDTWYKELYNNGLSIVDIGFYYGKIKEYGKKITVTNMQNLDNIAIELFDCVIFDELHNYGTKRLLPFLERDVKYKIGLSATVTRSDGNHMKMLKAFNYNMFKYTPTQALQEGILNPFAFTNIGVKMDEETTEKYNKLQADINLIYKLGGGYNKIMRSGDAIKHKMLSKLNERKALMNNYERKFDVMKLLCEKHKDDKSIIFNEFNEQTNKCYWELLDVGVKACVIHSNMPQEKRDENLVGFRSDKYSVMLASRVLDEGYNLPKLDVAIIMAGQSSARQTIQRMGRVLRKKDKESKLYQIYCVGTIEEEYSDVRSKMFKELSSKYEQFFYDGENLI